MFAPGAGMTAAEVNLAVVLELDGHFDASEAHFQAALGRMKAAGMPHRHVQIKRATVLPRILPNATQLAALR